MGRMTKYRFGGLLPLEPIRIRRLDEEKRNELQGNFEHVILPDSMRDLEDCACFRTIVEVPSNDEQVCKAFERAMNRCLERFAIDFYHEMQRTEAQP